jgi:ethanolamine ammonia-lyase small subunit
MAVDERWQHFKRVTRARIDLGRAGDALPTRKALEFEYACALARDAVRASFDAAAMAGALAPLPVIAVRSAAPDREIYLRRPDLGRRLREEDRGLLARGPYDAVIVVADGLSALAVQRHAAPLLRALGPHLAGWLLGPVVTAVQARVAIGDEIGAAMGAEMVVLLIGERPGLTAPDSLGIYLTFDPRIGRLDSQRNCISNVHGGGLPYEAAASTLAWLMSRARTLRLTGIALKEDAPRVAAPRVAAPRSADSSAVSPDAGPSPLPSLPP